MKLLPENVKYWLAINKIPNLGPVTIKKLWERFGTIEKVWRADERSIRTIEGINQAAVKAFLENRNRIDLADELARVSAGNINILTLDDAAYPKWLSNIYDPPPVLYLKGAVPSFETNALAVVGTRQASRYGLEFAKKLAGELAAMGFTIVSGMAEGIDTAAHEGALEARGRTIAVFGTGVDVIFPSQNRELAGRIEAGGALVSEFPLGTRGEKGNFPRRNRIISGLSRGVIVVEGDYDSGAMITAKQALEQGREVFAVPGNVGPEQSKGPHWLIKQGAKLVEAVEDVLEELNLPLPNSQIQKPKPDLSNFSSDEKKIISVLSREPKHIDLVSAEAGLPIPQVLSLLMMLEVRQVIRQFPGKTFVLYPHTFR